MKTSEDNRLPHIDLSVTIPVYDEQDNIEPLYDELLQVLEDQPMRFEIIFVNDGSRDGSARILDSLAERDPRVVAVHLIRNYGQTTAMMAGFDQARGEIVVVMDGDRQNDPADIPRLLDKMNEGYTVVSGWRKDRKDARLTKVIPSQVANRIISLVTGVRLHDYGCSLKAYHRTVIRELKLYGEMHRFIPVFSEWSGARVGEIIVNHRPRRSGASKYGFSRVLPVLLDLFLVRFMQHHMQHPIHFFGRFGVINMLLAAISFALMVYYKFWGGKTFIETPLPTLTVLFILIGSMAFLLGIVAELVIRTYYESQQKKPYRVERIVSDR
jgi:glycosyltransferase involved in cell wall biosynthesis